MSIDLNNNTPKIERAPRKRTYKKAIVRRKEMGGDRLCILRNISDTGALLEFEAANSLPMHFDVQVELDAMEVPAQWIRQEGERVGVKFTGPFKNINVARKQVFKSPDDPTLVRETKEKALLKQLYERRLSQTSNPAEDQDEPRDVQNIRKSPSRGFGKR